MTRRVSRLSLVSALTVSLFAALPGSAQISPAPAPAPFFLAGRWDSCEQLKEQCKEATAESIIYLASLDPGSPALNVGTCYVHSKASCPNCLCNDYVKLSWMGGQNGYDGDRGCVGNPNPSQLTPEESHKLAAEILKSLCESGACCCPEVQAKPCAVGTPVYARDPITGSCCTFPNPCSAPPAWKTTPEQIALCH